MAGEFIHEMGQRAENSLEHPILLEYYRDKIFDFESKAAHLDAWELLAGLSCQQGRFGRSEVQLEEGLKLAEEVQSKRWIRRFYTNLAFLAYRRGSTREALETIEKYGFRRPLDGIEIYASAKQFDKAEELAEKLRKSTENTQSLFYKVNLCDLSWAEGYIAMEMGDYIGAAAHFQKAQSLLSSPYQPNMDWYLNL